MGRWQPYLYNAPQRNSYTDGLEAFNPKAVTMASRMPPEPPKKKPDGPLIDLNKHPDSYLFVPYGKTNTKPMNPKVKTVIKIVRWIQFALRLCNLIGAVGVLLCGIFIRGAQDTEGYILRIPPGVDIATALYAIYHLLRAAKSRPAASSASYHFFALVTDAGFIPFYVFTTILAKRNSDLEAGAKGRWRTFFPTDEETDKVLLATWLTATTVAGLHCISLFLDIWLVIIFRKISHLPPDMNPLEENLTSRRKTKHKHKNSSLSTVTTLAGDEKRKSYASSNRNSQTAPLISEKEIPSPDRTQKAFLHTRTNSGMTYSPHTPNSARHSRDRNSLYQQTASNRQSRVDLHTRDDLLRRDDGSDNETLAQRKQSLAQQAIKRSSRPHSFVSQATEQFYTPPTTARNEKHDSGIGDMGDIALQKDLQSDNWFVYDGADDDDEPESHSPRKQSVFQTKKQAQGYNTVSAEDPFSDDEPMSPTLIPQPLRMNPPTPPPNRIDSEVRSTPPPSGLKRTQTTTSISSEATFSRSPTRASTPKSRYYGDLKAATQGIRNGGNSANNTPGSSPTKGSFTPSSLPSAAKQYSTNAPSTPTKYVKNSPFNLEKKSYSSVRRTGDAGYAIVRNQSPRVVSRSGVDYEGTEDYDVSDLGTPGRRREVSGKIAEEGRGGAGNRPGTWGMQNHGLTYRKVSGVA
ncbi:hypothetical protein BS50DRAFT_570677 [Corynespora cassiicola Philippines]|uniref:Uncharacterized protein n=1 Tax=Corynespora cassiicola Philippines TaxID=1448308 RepID=A0A2T2P0T9_CORCC|nr:hypothetical protein BS50DRAFT_570677 [Corynespora cassiicola Philippines]